MHIFELLFYSSFEICRRFRFDLIKMYFNDSSFQMIIIYNVIMTETICEGVKCVRCVFGSEWDSSNDERKTQFQSLVFSFILNTYLKMGLGIRKL